VGSQKKKKCEKNKPVSAAEKGMPPGCEEKSPWISEGGTTEEKERGTGFGAQKKALFARLRGEKKRSSIGTRSE